MSIAEFMSFLLSKILPLFVYPLGLSIGLMILAGILCWRGWRRPPIALVSFSAIFLWVTSSYAFSHWIRATLEWEYRPVAVEESPVADAIVLLGGFTREARPPAITSHLKDGADRAVHAARLYRAGKAPVVIVSGGEAKVLGTTKPESTAMTEYLVEWGVPKHAILQESKSVNTYENATYTKEILTEYKIHTVLLVTSALHMPRAVATFHSAGIDVIPSPTDYEAVEGNQAIILGLLPDVDALEGTTRAIKEYIGYMVYWLRGWIK